MQDYKKYPKPENIQKIKKFNCLVEVDGNSGSAYFFAPNIHPNKNPPKVTKTEQIFCPESNLYFNVDISNGILVGIELVGGVDILGT